MKPDPATWRERLEEAAGDREHGAGDIVRAAAEAFADGAGAGAESKVLRAGVIRLLRGHRAMAPVLRLGADLIEGLDRDGPARFGAVAQRWVRELAEATREFQRHLLDRPPTPRTWGFYSLSSTVRAGIEAMAEAGAVGEALVGESRPGGEGVWTAAVLSSLGWHVTLVPDTLFFDRVAEGRIERLILGCDACDDQTFVNKVGSGALASIARQRGIPVELWTTTHKFLTHESLLLLEITGSQSEELVAPREEVAVEQPLFGPGNLEDIALLRTERGAWTYAEVAAFIDQLPPLDASFLKP